ncbi:MAG: hypothetical protein OXC07_13325 [Kistimonas sp.]|nr:hypothetical protein [Kistimonas sp.]
MDNTPANTPPAAVTPGRPGAPLPAQTQTRHPYRTNWTWWGSGLAALAGLGACLVLNRLLPPTNLTRALGRYTLSLVPAACYLMHAAHHQCSSHIRIFSTVSPEEKARQRRLGIEPDAMMCTIYTAAWLEHPGSLHFEDEELLREYRRQTRSGSDLVALLESAREKGWCDKALPGGGVINTRRLLHPAPNQQERLPLGGDHFDIRLKAKNIPPSLGLDQLECGEVMLIFLVPLPETQGRKAHILAVHRSDSGELFFFNSTDSLRQGTCNASVSQTLITDLVRTAYPGLRVYTLVKLGKQADAAPA